MKNRNRYFFSLVSVIVAAVLVSPSMVLPAIQAMSGPVAVNETAGEPPVVTADLSKSVTQFELGNFLPFVNRPPFKGTPFTITELKQMGGKRITQVNGKDMVVSKKFNPNTKLPELVPIETYLAQLNAYESFVNKYGFTLRGGGGNLGKILYLNPKKPDGTKIGFKDERKQLLFDPTIYEHGDRMRDFKLNPADILARNRTASTTGSIQRAPTQVVTGDLRNQTNLFKTLMRREISLPKNSASHEPRVMTIDSPCPCAVCTKEEEKKGIIDSGTALNPIGSNPSPGSAPQQTTTKSMGFSCGAPGQCNAVSCLYEGYLSGQWTGISSCTNVANGNDWFDVGVCLDISSLSCGNSGTLNLRNGGSLSANMKIFGTSFSLMDVKAIGSYTDGKTNPEKSSNIFGQEVPGISYNQVIPGPGALFLIGPVPIAIRSKLTIGFELGNPTFQFPTKLNAKNCGASDYLNVGVGAKLDAGIDLTAAVDVYVASAGIDAKIVLAKDYAGIGIKTTVNPAKNEVVVEPGFQYDLKHLIGYVTLFAEVDLLLYTKRFEVEIFRLDSGLGTNGLVTEPLEVRKFNAVKLN
jgi:hypothetical protein